jgi:hypothetical protein
MKVAAVPMMLHMLRAVCAGFGRSCNERAPRKCIYNERRLLDVARSDRRSGSRQLGR